MSNSTKATTDYSIFKTLEGNRILNAQHVNRLARVIKEHNMTERFPIVVNKNMEILDGQHRLAALEMLELPVPYRIEDDVDIEGVRILNQVSRKWSWQDLARSYIEKGNDSYQILLDLNEERPGLFNIEALQQIANINGSRTNTRPRPNYFFGGGLELSEDQRKNLDILAHQLGDFVDTQPQLRSGAGNRGRELPRQYVTAMTRVMKGDNYKHREFLQRISTGRIELPRVVDTNEALRELEKAFNYNVREDNRVRLF